MMSEHRSLKTLLLFVLGILLSSGRINSQTLLEANFNKEDSLSEWRSFQDRTRPKVSLYKKSLLGARSSSGGLTALSRDFEEPQKRIAVEFSLAFAPSKGRSFHLWSHQPDGKDASQLNLCVQDGTLQHFDGRSRSWKVVHRNLKPTFNIELPIWHRIRVVVDSKQNGVAIFVSKPGELELPAMPVSSAAYRTELLLGGISFVSGTRIASDAWYRVDDLKVIGGGDIRAPGPAPKLPKPFRLWTGKPIPSSTQDIPWVDRVIHNTIHKPKKNEPKFLHGAALIHYKGALYANWANSPTNENGPHETLRGKKSIDGGRSWSPLQTIATGFEGSERHSHGILLEHNNRLWAICSRFGKGIKARRFDGLQAEAFVLDNASDRWISRGVVMTNCWPYDEPVRLANGNFITGGQDKDGLPVVAISEGDNILKWRSVLIPFPPELKPSFAETTVWAERDNVIAIIRGGGGVAWIAQSADSGATWNEARPTNLPMPRSKAYVGKLSTGQLYLLSNYRSRDTLCISVGDPGKLSLNRMYRIRDGKSFAPRYPGNAKGKQWSYPYGYEHDGKLYVVYSVGKEECGLSVIPIESLTKK